MLESRSPVGIITGCQRISSVPDPIGDARWMTYRQAQTKGYQVRRGEKGTQVQYWRFDHYHAAW